MKYFLSLPFPNELQTMNLKTVIIFSRIQIMNEMF